MGVSTGGRPPAPWPPDAERGTRVSIKGQKANPLALLNTPALSEMHGDQWAWLCANKTLFTTVSGQRALPAVVLEC